MLLNAIINDKVPVQIKVQVASQKDFS